MHGSPQESTRTIAGQWEDRAGAISSLVQLVKWSGGYHKGGCVADPRITASHNRPCANQPEVGESGAAVVDTETETAGTGDGGPV